MSFNVFTKSVVKVVSSHLRNLWATREDISGAEQQLFPTHCIIYNFGYHYGFELIGATTNYEKLNFKVRTLPSLDSFFDLFPNEKIERRPVFDLTKGGNNSFESLAIISGLPAYDIEKRFPVVNKFGSQLRDIHGQRSIASTSRKTGPLVFQHVLFGACTGNIIRARHINLFVSIQSLTPERDLERLLISLLWRTTGPSHAEPRGLIPCDLDQHDTYVLSQVQNAIFSPKTHETTIGDVLRLHPQLIRKFFGAYSFQFEVNLKWMAATNGTETGGLRPDLFVEREDGYFDIVDLKLARFDRKSLTKGESKRRRFADYVYEGIAQLCHYEEYFSHPENAQFALDTYGIKINNPRLILLVGNSENLPSAELNEAMRGHSGRRLIVVDYDMFVRGIIV